MTLRFLNLVFDGLIPLKGRLGKEWVGLGHPKFGCEFEVLWFMSVQSSCPPVFKPTSSLVGSVLSHAPVVGHLGYRHCFPTASEQQQ